MKTVRDIPLLKNVPILVRAAMNVPVEDDRVVNDYRLRRALPTIRFLSGQGARVILISHIGERGTETLAPIARVLRNSFQRLSFFGETVGKRAGEAVRNMLPGDVLVLENLRRSQGEKANDPGFARELAALADVFVQDSFDTCHRTHASIVGVPRLLPSYAGLTLEEEVRELRKALAPIHPSLAVIGGAKFNTKEAVLTTLLQTYDRVFVGGALAHDFFRAAGHPIGKSLASPMANDDVQKILANPKLVLPVDSLVITTTAPDSRHRVTRVAPLGQIHPDESIVDHGSGTNALMTTLTRGMRTILWNGPLGNYENGFVTATDTFARDIAASGARSVVGGGDTIAAIEDLGLLSRFSFVSTGGGAMLDFIAHGTLPGIVALG